MKIDFDDKELDRMGMCESCQVCTGRDQKGDLLVLAEPLDNNNIEISIKSSVSSMFGKLIRKTIEQALETLGVKNIRVEIKDNGALDHVILARLEAAVRRLYPIVGPGIIPEQTFNLKRNKFDRLRRTRLYLPGNNPDLMLNAGLFGADCVILDLEDSVSPADKDNARILVRNSLTVVDFGSSERIVRINPISSQYFKADMEMIVPQNPDVLLVPKCESAKDIKRIADYVRQIQKENLLERPVFLMPLIETSKGVLNAYEIAQASPNIVALCFGAEDFTADIGAERSETGNESFVARSMIVLAAKSAGLQALDTVYSDIANIEGLRTSAEEAKSLGFDGKGVIHPSQIEPIHNVFIPTTEQIEYAEKVLNAIEEAEKSGSGVASLGTKMIDAPVITRAKKVIALAKACGKI